jgi:hypothetical protein
VTQLEPFDRHLPSPIASLLDLRASARGSVVRAEQLTPVQERSYVPTGLEERVIDAATSGDPPACIVISGSAGGGKSAVLNRIARRGPDTFAAVLEDATHAEAPDQDQYERLVEFLAPLGDGQPVYSGRPLLIAMNTGMVIRLFDQLRGHRGPAHGFTALESELHRQLLLPDRPSEFSLPGPLLVVNLDLRATAGGTDSLFAQMLLALDPDRNDGVMAGAPRCESCLVRDYCFVRTNAQILSSGPARASVDRAAEEIALSRGRPLQPRELWDFAVDLITGGEQFPAGDPCDEIARLAGEDDGDLTVWKRIANNGAFLDPISSLGAELSTLDPSYEPDEAVHELITGAGIDPQADGDALEELLGASAGREAIRTAAEVLRKSRLVTEAGDYNRAAAGRALVRAAALAGEVDLTARDAGAFVAALNEYANPAVSGDADGSALENLHRIIASGLTVAFGTEAGVERYFFTRAYDPRRTHSVLVHANIDSEDELFHLVDPDPIRHAAGKGASIAGYRPYAIAFRLAGVELRIDLPLFRLLRDTASGTRPSSADLERFFHLRRAAEALGRQAATDKDRPLLIAERDSGRRYRLARRRDVRGNPVLAVQEVQ